MQTSSDQDAPCPLTLITGFLGAGKTTLLNRVLQADRTEDPTKFGVLVNDFGAINIDAALIEEAHEGVVRLTNGCICCSMRGDVSRAVFRLLEAPQRPDHIVVEASGLSDPGTLTETFLELQRSGIIRLDGVICLLDAEGFDRLEGPSALLAKCQVLASDLVVINKIDLVDDAQRQRIQAKISEIAPDARTIQTEQAKLPLEVLFSLEHRARAAHFHMHDGAFDSHSAQRPKPLGFKTLVQGVKALPSSVLRIKGIIHVQERPQDRIAFHAVGKRVHIRTLGKFEDSPVSTLVFITQGPADKDAFDRLLDEAEAPIP